MGKTSCLGYARQGHNGMLNLLEFIQSCIWSTIHLPVHSFSTSVKQWDQKKKSQWNQKTYLQEV